MAGAGCADGVSEASEGGIWEAAVGWVWFGAGCVVVGATGDSGFLADEGFRRCIATMATTMAATSTSTAAAAQYQICGRLGETGCGARVAALAICGAEAAVAACSGATIITDIAGGGVTCVINP